MQSEKSINNFIWRNVEIATTKQKYQAYTHPYTIIYSHVELN